MGRGLSRRAFLGQGSLVLAGLASGKAWAAFDSAKPLATIGLLTDIHHANKGDLGSRCYRASLSKVDFALSKLVPQRPDRLVHLGDLIDSHKTDLEEEMAARTVAQRFLETGIPYHLLMGNHCLSRMTKDRYGEVTKSAGTYEAFDINGVRFLCLDACYRSDGVDYGMGKYDWQDCFIPDKQIDWIERQLSSAKGPAVVFSHQLLDGMPTMSIRNHEKVREVLAKSGKVAAVLQGHFHQNRLRMIQGVPYTVLRSVIDGPEIANCGFSRLSVFADGSVKLDGFEEQETFKLSSFRTRRLLLAKSHID